MFSFSLFFLPRTVWDMQNSLGPVPLITPLLGGAHSQCSMSELGWDVVSVSFTQNANGRPALTARCLLWFLPWQRGKGVGCLWISGGCLEGTRSSSVLLRESSCSL